jgi:ligand-binding sensor domain-containing protein
MRQISLLFIILSFSAPVFLQMPDLNFTDIANEEKLSSTFASCIEQDTTGYIWVGTSDGLNRFDGYDITVYRHKPNNDSSLVNNNISCLFNDSRDRLWIGTHSGLCIYNRSYNSFKRIISTNDSAGLENITITQLGEDQKQMIYVASGSSIYVFDEQKTCFEEILNISHGEISSFVFDKDNNIWIGSFPDGGLFHYNRNTEELKRYVHDEGNRNSVAHNSVMSVALKDERLWIATFGGGTNSFDLKTGNVKRYPVSDPYEIYVKKVYIDRKE